MGFQPIACSEQPTALMLFALGYSLFATFQHRFIRVRGEPVQRGLQFGALHFQVRIGRIGRHPNGLSPPKQPAPERKRDLETIPACEDFFFEQPKVTGTIGKPVALANCTTPSLATYLGPFGPSGVTARSAPERPTRINSRKAAAPPRVLDPLTARMPNLAAILAISSPSRCRLTRTYAPLPR